MNPHEDPEDNSAGVVLMAIAQLSLMLLFLFVAVAIYCESPDGEPDPIRSIIVASNADTVR